MLDSSLLNKLYTHPLQRKDVHSCEMTYIYPNYYRVQPQPNSRLSKKYTLYLYREGYVDSEQLVGVPALFIPGQAGSYKQVRSIASETSKESYLKKASKSMQDIDWFTLDLNEELTAFAGQHILDQATYCNAAIETILDLYKGKVNSVIIVGHSMGGIVARTILMQPNYIPNSINTIVTLATPHLNPPILLDPVLDQVYHDLSRYWQPSQFEAGALQEVTLVSIAGGSLDTIVHSDSIGLQYIVPDSHGFATYSTAIPFVWTGSDHMAILWCNQLVKRLATTLVDVSGSFKNVSERMDIFRRYLLEEQLDSFKNQEFNISKNVQILNLSNQKGYRLSSTMNEPRLSLIQNTRNFHFLTDIPKEYDDQWQLVTCEKSGLDQWMCKTIRPTITLLPSASAESLVGSIPYRSINVRLDQPVSYIGLMEKGEVVIPNHPFVIIYNGSTTVHKSTIWDIVRHKGEMLTVKGYYSKHIFPQLYHSLFAYDLHVVQSTPKAHTIFEPMMKQTIHGKEAKFYRNLKENVSDKIMFHQTPGDEGLAFSFYTDNQPLGLLIRVDWYATLGRCMLRYGSILTNYLYVCASLILFTQSCTYVVTLRSKKNKKGKR
ncbi:hypothetical protein G6F46_003628 [Rhizopus delemar]|uniref:GPI inositol-deacylase n=2 Tax=Rhizopus TaxID=4842 RepID=A0A9P6Z8D0_9FUNG|nr:hypothetical protein G6F54_003013 [Rhizopus delemar]KAG1548263.1 hypothetical protein G6F51_003764 [Rhizopus arrhizus]KAG1516213.1 hypothetical protein G6F53_002330 [Rhizopus delemar]KAG1524795.1 hypothetical protein G6F52_003897 [Rhizopus delemar]KAG1572816.1 hypothetical protein G6F50_003403 [Rhizopus delemar]